MGVTLERVFHNAGQQRAHWGELRCLLLHAGVPGVDQLQACPWVWSSVFSPPDSWQAHAGSIARLCCVFVTLIVGFCLLCSIARENIRTN